MFFVKVWKKNARFVAQAAAQAALEDESSFVSQTHRKTASPKKKTAHHRGTARALALMPEEEEEPVVVETAASLRALAVLKGEAALATARLSQASPNLVANLLLFLGRARRLALEDDDQDEDRHIRESPADSSPRSCAQRLARNVSKAANAQRGALLAARTAAHEHSLMRYACLELVALYASHSVPETAARHLQLATHYLSLAAELAHKHRLLFVDTAHVASRAGDLDADSAKLLRPQDLDELTSKTDAIIPASSAIRYLLALKREADAPGALSDDRCDAALEARAPARGRFFKISFKMGTKGRFQQSDLAHFGQFQR